MHTQVVAQPYYRVRWYLDDYEQRGLNLHLDEEWSSYFHHRVGVKVIPDMGLSWLTSLGAGTQWQSPSLASDGECGIPGHWCNEFSHVRDVAVNRTQGPLRTTEVEACILSL